jgi:hypothetical protein
MTKRALKTAPRRKNPSKFACHLLWRDTGKNAEIRAILLANPCPASLRLSTKQKKKIGVSYFHM